MKKIIIYDSLTGNTEEMADIIKKEFPDAFYEKINDKLIEHLPEGDIYFIGTPIIKGMCTEKIKKLLQKLQNKKVFLFATAGFGGSEEYFDTLKERIIGELPNSNYLVGSFFCQGKMQEQVKAKYLQLITDNPADKNLQVSLQNFEQAKTHPDDNDKNNLIKKIKHKIDMK